MIDIQLVSAEHGAGGDLIKGKRKAVLPSLVNNHSVSVKGYGAVLSEEHLFLADDNVREA